MAFQEQKRCNSNGFTLLEVLMAVMLAAILAKFAISQYADFQADAKKVVSMDRLNSLKTAIMGDSRMVANGKYTKPGFYTHCGNIPLSLNDLQTMPTASPSPCITAYNAFTKMGWRGPYVSTSDSSWNKDGWGNTIQYPYPSRSLQSCGSTNNCNATDAITITF